MLHIFKKEGFMLRISKNAKRSHGTFSKTQIVCNEHFVQHKAFKMRFEKWNAFMLRIFKNAHRECFMFLKMECGRLTPPPSPTLHFL